MPPRKKRTRRPAPLARCVNLADVEAVARKRMRPAHHDYFAGGAEDEQTLRENRDAFARLKLRHRVLVDVSRVDPAAAVLGTPISAPILLAPAAYHRLAHPQGELATARAAEQVGIVMVVSTMATTSLEEIAAATSGTLWFQLYVYRDRPATESLVRRAEGAGYRALVLTVDTPILGRRERDARNRFSLPRGMRMANFGAGTGEMPWVSGGSGFLAYAKERLDASLTWEALGWLRRLTSLPIVVKGVVRAEDAERAVEAGAAGIIVSNHGGRQLDCGIATVDALPEVVAAVAGRIEVYVDGGVRRGTDVLKSLALGARAVLIGRPYLWGLAADGAAGVERVVAMLKSEFEDAMALAGCPEVGAIRRDLIA